MATRRDCCAGRKPVAANLLPVFGLHNNNNNSNNICKVSPNGSERARAWACRARCRRDRLASPLAYRVWELGVHRLRQSRRRPLCTKPVSDFGRRVSTTHTPEGEAAASGQECHIIRVGAREPAAALARARATLLRAAPASGDRRGPANGARASERASGRAQEAIPRSTRADRALERRSIARDFAR